MTLSASGSRESPEAPDLTHLQGYHHTNDIINARAYVVTGGENNYVATRV